MIRTIINDINDIIDAQAETDATALIVKLDAEIKYYLNQAFLDDKLFDYKVNFSNTPVGFLLDVDVQLSSSSMYDSLTWDLDVTRTSAADEAYKRAMSGI